MRNLLMALLMLLGFAATAQAQLFVVHSPDDGFLNLRAKPNSRGAIIRKLKHGSLVEVYRRLSDENWAEVIAPKGVFGFVSLKYLRRAPGHENKRVIASPDGVLNLRSGPGTQFEILSELHNEQFTVTILEQKGTWARIRDYNGQVGWVNSKYLR